MVDAIKPNLIQTMEGQPVFCTCGPFANIALGKVLSSPTAWDSTFGVPITESGFGADIGYEKFGTKMPLQRPCSQCRRRRGNGPRP
jgi:formate--tetrahydrofolate ligase